MSKPDTRRILLLSLAFAALALLTPGNDARADLKEIKDRGYLIAGTTGRFPPFTGINSSGEVEGVDVDWLKAIAEKIGIQIRFVTVEGAGLIPGLLANKFDTVSASLVITEERLKAVNFPEPYSASGTVMLVRADDARFQSYMDLNDRTIGVILGSVDERRLRSVVSGWKDLKTYPGWSEQWSDLLAGRVDGLSTDYHVAKFSMAKERDAARVKVAGDPVFRSVSGFPVRKEDPQLLAAMTDAIRKLKVEGFTQKTSKKWLGHEVTPEFIELSWAEVKHIGRQ